VNLSSEANQQFFADGLAEDLITRLSYLRGLSVVAGTLTYTFRNTTKPLPEISREIGARYVLEGSVRASGSRLRVTTNLVDGDNALSIWSQRFDRDLTDLFEVQDEMTHAIVLALQVALSDGEMALDPGGTENYEAWEAFQRGSICHLKYTAEDNLRARRMFGEAIRLDPSFVDAKVFHAWTFWQHARSGFSSNRQGDFAKCRTDLDSLLAAGTVNANVKHLEAATLLMERRHDEALAAAEEAVALGPSKLFGYAPAALVRIYSGELQAGAAILRETIRTIPATPTDSIYQLANVLVLTGEYSKAIEMAQEYMRRVPDDLYGYLTLAIAFSFGGFPEEARGTIGRFRERFPTYRLADYEAHEPYRDKAILDSLLSHLRSAGFS
jgi:TolB-like protein